MSKHYTKEEKRAILAIVDACVVFTEDQDGFASYPWIRSVLRMVTGRDLLWTSWVRHVRRWRKDPSLEWNPPEIVVLDQSKIIERPGGNYRIIQSMACPQPGLLMEILQKVE